MRSPRKSNKSENSTPFLFPTSSIDYELLDCGNNRKLERFGSLVLDRPEVEANGSKRLSKDDWEKADWHFYEQKGKKGVWTNKSNAPSEWKMSYKYKATSLHFDLKLTAFKHVGLFPEQAVNWNYIQQQLVKIKGEKKVLNLFAYTGAASIVAAKNGAQVSNVDSVKQVLNWGRQNAENNNQDNIRWILEDARKFIQKSLRRGDRYHGIIMDPPAFGYGNKNEKWKLESDLPGLLESSIKLLDPKQHFFILNTYSPKLSLQSLKTILKETPRFPSNYEASILGFKSSKQQSLPLGNLIRFSK